MSNLQQILGPWYNESNKFQEIFNSAKPFPHVVIDNFLDSKVAEECITNFPSADSDIWHRYQNPIEIKLTCNNLKLIPEQLRNVLEQLNSQEFADIASQISGIDNLLPDPHLHGGGLHMHAPGGKLDMHLDYSINPLSGKERRLNLILYMNKNWKDEYGGHLELWDNKDGKLSECVTKVSPIFNRGVLFRVSDISYHGLPDPIQGPLSRKSIATYYLTEPREGVEFRPKAVFFPRPWEPKNDFMDKLRQIRAKRLITQEDLKQDN